MQARSTAAQNARREEAARIIAENARVTDDDSRKKRTLAQLDKLDGLIDAALAAKNEARFLRLSAAKERLWKLVQPTAGSLRPSSRQHERRAPLMPVDPPQAPVPPA